MRLAAIVMLVMLPATARASAPTPGAFGPLPAELHAGQTVELTWDRAPAGARELEILLYPSPDARTAIRVTAEIDGERSRARWRVPNVPAEGARLALRWGDAGGEFAGAWSAPFRIVADPGRAPERALVVEGPRPLGDDAAPARELADGARLAAHDDGVPVAEAPARGNAGARATACARRSRLAPGHARPAVQAPRASAPEVIPQRN